MDRARYALFWPKTVFWYFLTRFSFKLLHDCFACINASLYYLEFLFKAMITEDAELRSRLTNNNLDKITNISNTKLLTESAYLLYRLQGLLEVSLSSYIMHQPDKIRQNV